jgi:hypothetical protein
MSERIWRTLGEWTQVDAPGYDETLTEQLTMATRPLNVPLAVEKRMQVAVITAVRRAFQRDNTRAAEVTVSAQVAHSQESPIECSWGLFLVEKGTEGLEPHQIAVMLYPDERKRRANNADINDGSSGGASFISAAHPARAGPELSS